MLNPRQGFLIGLLLLALALAACAGSQTAGPPPVEGTVWRPAPAEEPSPTALPPTATPTALPTRTPLPTVTPTVVSTVEPTPPVTTYVVQAGDTLSAIALAQGVTLGAIVAANNIENPDLIRLGQTLIIPPAGDAPVAASSLPSESTSVPATNTPTPDLPPLPTISTPIPSPTPPQSPPTLGENSESLPVSPPLVLASLQDQLLLSPMSHEWQKLNNCAPATVAMALSFYGEGLTQFNLAPILKGGDQDKNVSPGEIAAYLNGSGYRATVRINGDLDILMRLVSNGVPVMAEQWLDRPDDELTGHYRLVRGYDQEAGVIIVNDSYNGPELRFPYAEFERLWRAFNRLYIPIYRPDQEPLVREIIGEDWDDEAMYRRALAVARQEVEEVGDLYAWFNLGDDYLGLGQDEEAVAAFERALAFGLPPRMLWYRFGPFEAYNRTGQYQKTLDLAAPLLAAMPLLEEVHYQQGVAYQGLGRLEEAIVAYQLALQYNSRFQLAQEALTRLRESAGP